MIFVLLLLLSSSSLLFSLSLSSSSLLSLSSSLFSFSSSSFSSSSFSLSSLLFFHLRSMNSILSDWVSFLAYPNLFGIKGFVVVVAVVAAVLNLAQKSPA
jgi:hypothetical protein